MKPPFPVCTLCVFFLYFNNLQGAASFSWQRGATLASHRSRTRCFASTRPLREGAHTEAAAEASDAPRSINTTEASSPSTTKTPKVLQSVIRPSIRASPNVWQNVCPGIFEDSLGIDVRLQWDKDEGTLPSTSTVAERVASNMVTHIGERVPISKSQITKATSSLAKSFETFASFCNLHLERKKVLGYSARVVATRGSPSTKCPVWHRDYVPVRWIQSLVGPGCQWVHISNNDDDWSAMNAQDDAAEPMAASVEEMNHQRVDPRIPVHQAAPGEPVILVGRAWSRYCRRDSPLFGLQPVVHKSPDGFKPWQGRILLTIDVITTDEGDE